MSGNLFNDPRICLMLNIIQVSNLRWCLFVIFLFKAYINFLWTVLTLNSYIFGIVLQKVLELFIATIHSLKFIIIVNSDLFYFITKI